MENEYSKIFDYFYTKTENKAEKLLKNLFLTQSIEVFLISTILP